MLLDLSGVSFMDVIGLHVIEEAADAARHGGFGFAIAGPVPTAVRHVFVEAGAEHDLPRAGPSRSAAPSVVLTYGLGTRPRIRRGMREDRPRACSRWPRMSG